LAHPLQKILILLLESSSVEGNMEVTSRHKKLIYCIFSLSGFCALIYEILWTKYLSLTFGNTMVAVSVVAATFMAGLAIGSFLLGRYVDRKANLLKIYCYLELGIALTALLFAPTLGIVEHLYVYWTQRLPELPWLVTLIHILFSSMLLLPPTICMGGTFPLMCRFFARRKSGAQIGRLYALNTLGATLGAFSAGYLLIPSMGLSKSGYLAITLNLLVGIAAYLLALCYGSTDASGESEPGADNGVLAVVSHRPILIGIAFVGFFSLAYEILWTRLLLLYLGNTSYAFSLMLSAYLVGIAVGGALYARLAHPKMNEKRLFLVLATLMATVVMATAPHYDQLAYLFQFAHEVSGERWWLLSLFSFLIVFAVISLPTILSGALLPAAVAIIDPGKSHTGQGVGMVVLHNTVGAVLGSLCAGFLMIPSLGLLNSFRALAFGNLLLVVILTVHYRHKLVPRWLVPALCCCALFIALIPGNWNMELINSGVYCYAQKYAKMGGLNKVLKAEKLIEVIEGSDCTVAVHESLNTQIRFFSVNGKTDGGTGSDMATQVLIGQLPLLMHPQPDDVLVVGLGTGITLNAMSSHPTKKITCVEISPEVVKAESYFSHVNGFALKDPKVSLVVNDGRNQLFTKTNKYDVIVSQPSNPWQSGNANLFTDDFYRLSATRLKKGGLFCQWLGLYDITTENLRTACRTFLKTFPRVLVFRSEANLILVGAQDPLTIDYQQMLERFAEPEIARLFASVKLETPAKLIASQYLFTEKTLTKFAGNGLINSDDKPILEFSAHHNLGENTLGELKKKNLAALYNVQGSRQVLPIHEFGDEPAAAASNLREIGESFAKLGKYRVASQFINKANSYNHN
jgi:spermidine synthase